MVNRNIQQMRTFTCEIDLSGIYTTCDSNITTLTGYSHEEIPKLKDKFLKYAENSQEFKHVVNGFIYKDGNLGILEISGTPIFNKEDFLTSYQLIYKDIKETSTATHLLEQYNNILENNFLISKTNLNGEITFVNDLFCDTAEYSRETLLGKTHRLIKHSDTETKTIKEIWKLITHGDTWSGFINLNSKWNKEYLTYSVITPIKDTQGKIVEYLAIRNIVDAQIVEQSTKSSQKDNLTHLYNRNRLINDIKRSSAPYLAFLNIDNFRTINDYFGLEAGDGLLKELALLLLEQDTENNDISIYKLPSDEYAILAKSEGYESKNFINFIRLILRNIENYVFTFEKIEFHIQMTAGITTELNNFL